MTLPANPQPLNPPAPDMTAILAELDDLALRAAVLRGQVARLSAMPPGRPGWPIRRIPQAGPGSLHQP